MSRRVAHILILITLLFVLAGGIFACYPVVTVEFDTMGGSGIEKQFLSKGSKATRPAEDPVKEGHTFDNWYTSPYGNIAFNFEKTKIKKNTTIYARWRVNTYSISFVTEGTKVDDVMLPFNSQLDLFESYLTGYIFNGWYLDSERTIKFTDKTMPAQDLTLYAGWIPDKNYSAFEFEKNQTGYTLVSVKDLKLNYIEIPPSYYNEPINKVGRYAFANVKQIKEIFLPDSILEVEPSAFEGCTSVERVYLPSLAEISDRMFYGCSSLKTVNFSDGLKRIGNSSFYGCGMINDFVLPNSIEHIGEKAFYGCSITTINIPDNVEELNTDLFYNCYKLSKVNLSNNLKRIGSGVFENCSSLKNLELPESLEFIDSRAFSGSGLIEITLPKNVNSTGEEIFFNCRNLRSVTILSQITRLKLNTFYLCMDLVDVVLPNSILYFEEGVFEDCHDLEEIILPNGLISLGKKVFRNCVSLREVSLPDNISEIPAYAFERCVSLQKIDLPNGLKSIKEFAFSYCYSLESISLPDDLESIGFKAFYDCSKIDNFNFNENLWLIGAQAFSGTRWLKAQSGDVYAGNVFYSFGGGTEVKFKNGTLAIAGGAFYGCESLDKIDFCPTIKYIGESAFEGCVNIEQILLPLNLKILGNNAFKNCIGLESIIFNYDLEMIGNNAFTNCIQLKEIEIFSVKNIGSGAFSECKSLKKVILPEGMNALSEDIFSNCISLEQIVIPKSVTSIGRRAFFSNISLECVELNNGLISIGSSAFEGCSKLTFISLPNSVEAVMPFAFKDSAITKLIIGSGIVSIGEQAFATSNLLYSKDIDDLPEMPELSDSRGMTVLLHGMPVVSANSFPVGEHLKIILYNDSLFEAIKQNKFNNPALINWSIYKNYVFSSNQIENGFLRHNDKLITYIGNDSHIIIPEWVTEISPYAFFEMSFISRVTLNEELVLIGNYAFYGTSITTLNINQKIAAIGKRAFYVKTYLREISVIIKDASTHSTPVLGEDAFKLRGYHSKSVNGILYYKFENDDKIYDSKINEVKFEDESLKNRVLSAFEEIANLPYRKNIIYISSESVFNDYLISWSQYKDYLYWKLN